MAKHWRDVDYAWAAGFLDGEGCFSAFDRPRRSIEVHACDPRRPAKGWRCRIGATQVVREPLDRLQAMFGGRVFYDKRIWRWNLDRKSHVREALMILRLYLVVKEAEALALLDYLDAAPVVALKTYHLNRVRELKQKRTPAPES